MLNKIKTRKGEGMKNVFSGFTVFCRPSEYENWKLRAGRSYELSGLQRRRVGWCWSWWLHLLDYLLGQIFGCFY